MTAEPIRRRFTVQEYYQMAESGILTEDDRVELLEGEIIEMTPIGSRHAGHVKIATNLFKTRVPDNFVISVQDPIRLGDHSEPEPDVAILKPRDDFYASAHPGPDDVLLVVEVADTSLEYDRDRKIPLYARFGIPNVLLVNLRDETVEFYEAPRPDDEAYQMAHTLRGEATFEVENLGLQFEAADFFV